MDHAIDWIPCTVRQPEVEGLYLVTAKQTGSRTRYVTVREWIGECQYYPGHWSTEEYQNLLAWSVLPIPWKETK